jgi:hypothetical protein
MHHKHAYMLYKAYNPPAAPPTSDNNGWPNREGANRRSTSHCVRNQGLVIKSTSPSKWDASTYDTMGISLCYIQRTYLSTHASQACRLPKAYMLDKGSTNRITPHLKDACSITNHPGWSPSRTPWWGPVKNTLLNYAPKYMAGYERSCTQPRL